VRYGRDGRRGRRRSYVTGYLKSIPWFRRRDRWFEEETARAGVVRCTICSRRGTKRTLELHHLDYAGVTHTDAGGWIAGEEHEDLVAAHPRCHEWIHTILDRDPAASSAVDRRRANERVIARLRAKFAAQIGEIARRDDGR